MPLSAVFFDLDETLLDDETAYRQAVRLTARAVAGRRPHLDAAIVESTYLETSDEVWRSVEGTGALSGPEIRLRVWTAALRALGVRDGGAAAEAADLYTRHRRATYRLFPDTEPVLRALSGRYILGVITNGAADVQREKVAATGLDSFFPVIVPSGEAGAWKPSPLIFERALSLAGVRPEEALHVGDNLVNDVAGAQGAGLRGVWLNRRGAARPAAGPAPDIEIGDLHGLLPHLPPPAGPA